MREGVKEEWHNKRIWKREREVEVWHDKSEQ